MSNKSKLQTQKLVLGAVMTGLVIILQLLGSSTTFFGPFSTAVGLIPISIGAMLCGPYIGAWLGLVFAIVIFASGVIIIQEKGCFPECFRPQQRILCQYGNSQFSILNSQFLLPGIPA